MSADAGITVDDHGKLAVVPSIDSATVDIDASTAGAGHRHPDWQR